MKDKLPKESLNNDFKQNENYEDQYFHTKNNQGCLAISHFNISKNYKFVTFNIFYQSFEIFMVITNYVTENPSVQNCKRTP